MRLNDIHEAVSDGQRKLYSAIDKATLKCVKLADKGKLDCNPQYLRSIGNKLKAAALEGEHEFEKEWNKVHGAHPDMMETYGDEIFDQLGGVKTYDEMMDKVHHLRSMHIPEAALKPGDSVALKEVPVGRPRVRGKVVSASGNGVVFKTDAGKEYRCLTHEVMREDEERGPGDVSTAPAPTEKPRAPNAPGAPKAADTEVKDQKPTPGEEEENNRDAGTEIPGQAQDVGSVAKREGYAKSKTEMFAFGATRPVTLLTKDEKMGGMEITVQYVINPKTGAWSLRAAHKGASNEDMVEFANGEDPTSLAKNLQKKNKITAHQVVEFLRPAAAKAPVKPEPKQPVQTEEPGEGDEE